VNNLYYNHQKYTEYLAAIARVAFFESRRLGTLYIDRKTAESACESLLVAKDRIEYVREFLNVLETQVNKLEQQAFDRLEQEDK